MEKTDAIPGGLAQGKTLTDLVRKLDPKGYYHNDQLLNALKKELGKGIEVEMEHTSDPKVAKEIALDHLFEDPRYYTKLKKANLEEEDVAERKLTKKEKTGLTKIHKDVSKKPFVKQYGKEEGEKVYYATTTKMAKKKY